MSKEKTKTVAKLVGATSCRPNFEGKTKKQKGITLIALIITIIVMLILVGVTVSVSLNGGLFNTAKQATSDTEAEREKEETLSSGRVKIDGVWYDSMDDYVNKIPSENQEDTTEESPELGLLRTYFLGEKDKTTGKRPGKSLALIITSPDLDELLTANPSDIVFADDEENTGILSEDLLVTDFSASKGIAYIKYNNKLYKLTVSADFITLTLDKAIRGTIISDTDTTNPSEIEITYDVSGGYITFYVRPKGKLSTVEYKEEYYKDFSTEELENLYVQLEYYYDTVDNYAAVMAQEDGITVEEAKQSILEDLKTNAENSGKEYEEYLKDELVKEYYRPYILGFDLFSLTGEEIITEFYAKQVEIIIENATEEEIESALLEYKVSTVEELKTLLIQMSSEAILADIQEEINDKGYDYDAYCKEYVVLISGFMGDYSTDSSYGHDYKPSISINNKWIYGSIDKFRFGKCSFEVSSGDVISYGVTTKSYGTRTIEVKID